MILNANRYLSHRAAHQPCDCKHYLRIRQVYKRMKIPRQENEDSSTENEASSIEKCRLTGGHRKRPWKSCRGLCTASFY